MAQAGLASGDRRRRSTIVDVANEAGVAIGTVSRYLNGFSVRRDNRAQIENAIQRLGYRRNALAAAIKSDLSNTVGFLVPSFSEYHTSVLEQLSQRMREAGLAVLSYCHNDNPASLVDALNLFASHRVDCLVMDGNEGVEEGVRELIAGGTPVILYDNDVAGLPVDRVMVENRRASARAVTHLLDIGHTKVAVLAGNLHNHTGRERFAGYKDAMEERGLSVRPEYIIDADWTEDRGYSGMLRLLSMEDPPTAVFSCNYRATFGALAMLRERGYRVPDDISIVSFDDVPLFRLHPVGITAIAQPVDQIADAITRLMLSGLAEQDGHRTLHTITLGCDLILRGSTQRKSARD
jgi:LacI family transcriptional regulator